MNSVLYKAIGISNYNALQLQARKRLSFGLTFTASYTWSHALDEQSGEGIFFTGNNPLAYPQQLRVFGFRSDPRVHHQLQLRDSPQVQRK